MPSILQHHREEYDDRNVFLQALLGLISLAETLEAEVAEGGRSRADRESNDPTLEVLLGLAALSTRGLLHARLASDESAVRSPLRAHDPPPAPGSILA